MFNVLLTSEHCDQILIKWIGCDGNVGRIIVSIRGSHTLCEQDVPGADHPNSKDANRDRNDDQNGAGSVLKEISDNLFEGWRSKIL